MKRNGHQDNQQVLQELAQSELFGKVGDICASVNTTMSTRELLEISLQKTMALFGARRGSIFILSENGKDLALQVSEGMKDVETEQLVKQIGDGVVGHVAKCKKPIFVSDITRDDRFLNYKARKSYKTPSFICAPLLIKDELIGVINITDKEGEARFNKHEMQLLDFLSSQIALNYRRLQLYQKFRNVLKESKDLRDRLGRTTEETSDLKQKMIAQEKLATVGKLAGGIAHEFNNPLDGVIRYTNLCLEHVHSEDVVYGYLLEIKNGLKRMANIVKSLLACARSVNPTMEMVNPAYAVEQALLGLQTEIVHKNIRTDVRLGKDLPEIKDQGFERVVTNLVRNAVDAVEQNGSIGISAQYRDGQIYLDVKDDGCGIKVKDFDQIFEPFYTTKDIDKGCGLGLTIVGEIVKSYNGEIDVESHPGKGSQFTVKIPVLNEHKNIPKTT